MTDTTAAARKKEDAFEAVLLDQIRNCSASLDRGFAAMLQHEELSVAREWSPISVVDFFASERASLMRMVDGTAKLASAAARLRREANLNLKITHAIADAGKHRATTKSAGSIPKQNVANDAVTAEAAE